LLLKVEYELKYYRDLKNKLARVKRRIPIYIDIFAEKGTIFVISLDDALSTTFLYSAYLNAKERGLKSSLLYARYIEEDWFPEEVRVIGRKWLNKKYKGLSKKEINLLKKCNITEYVFARWCRW
jgi:hypothetical protein